MRFRRARMVSLFLACILLLAACSSREAEPKVPQEPESQGKGQILNVIDLKPVTHMTSQDPQKKKYQIQTRLTDFHLLTDTTGIAWGITRGELRLYMTKDNGVTWANISPAATVQFPGAVRYGKEIIFRDALHGWVVRSGVGNSETIVLHTEDGGLSWKISSLPDTAQVSDLSFISNDEGWIMSVESSSVGNQRKTLYRTLNGGKSWNAVMQTPISTNNQGSNSKAIPEFGYVTDMTFASEQVGYVTMQELNSPKMYVTSDGGHSWSASKNFFNKIIDGTCDQYLSSDLEFTGVTGNQGRITIACTRSHQYKYSGYTTQNHGETWSFMAYSLPWVSGNNKTIAPTFLNQNEGWSIQNSLISHTVDQGKTWSLLPRSEKLARMMKDYPEVSKMEFVSSKVGWILIQNYELRKSLLLQTKDGGTSWQVL